MESPEWSLRRLWGQIRSSFRKGVELLSRNPETEVHSVNVEPWKYFMPPWLMIRSRADTGVACYRDWGAKFDSRWITNVSQLSFRDNYLERRAFLFVSLSLWLSLSYKLLYSSIVSHTNPSFCLILLLSSLAASLTRLTKGVLCLCSQISFLRQNQAISPNCVSVEEGKKLL